MTGRYIALEGIEGAGKSTVAALVGQWLQSHGLDVVYVREPGGTPTGERIRDILLDPDGAVAPWTEAMLFAASRAQLVRDIVRPALLDGRWVISDRSVYSSLAYQGIGRGLGLAEVRRVNEAGLDGVWPDLVVLLRLDPTIGWEREAVKDRFAAEGLDLQHRVSRAFDTLSSDEPQRFLSVDASEPAADVVAAICRHLEKRWLTSSAT